MRAKRIAGCAIVAACLTTCDERQPITSSAALSRQRADPATEAMLRRPMPQRLTRRADAAGTRRRGRPDAMGHLPGGCRAVVRLDVPRLLDLPAARDSLLPTPARSGDAHGAALSAVREALERIGVDIGDLDHVAMCVTHPAGEPTLEHLTITIAGAVPQGELVHALIRGGDGFHGVRIDDDTTAAHHPASALYLAQARDGTVIVSNDRRDLIQAVGEPGEHGYGHDRRKALSAMLPAESIARLLHATPNAALEARLQRAAGAHLELDVPTRSFRLTIDMPEAEGAAELAGVLEAHLGRRRAVPHHTGEALAEAVEAARAYSEGRAAIVVVTVPHDQLAPVTRQLADRLRAD